MIKIENCHVDNITRAVYSARNAMNSWAKSDSDLNTNILGEADLKLAKKLVKAGSDHRKFLRMIDVTVDITAPTYWWSETDTYKIGTVRNSCSTMHKLMAKEFELDDFSHEHLVPGAIAILNELIDVFNDARKAFFEYDSMSDEQKNAMSEGITCKEDVWWQIIQLLPKSHNQRATLHLNYEVLGNMYRARKEHKLTEWHTFCEWIEGLPYAADLIVG